MEEYEGLYPDDDVEEEAISDGEGTNRTFIILVSAFGAILALGICAFIIYAVVGDRWRQGNQAAGVDPGTAVSALETPTEELTGTVDAPPGETVAPSVTATLRVGSGATRAAETDEATPGSVTPPAATPTSRVTPRPTFTPGPPTSTPTEAPPTPTSTPVQIAGQVPTATTRSEQNNPSDTAPPGVSPPLSTPDTGLGAFGASILAVGLLLLLVVVRQLRKAGR